MFDWFCFRVIEDYSVGNGYGYNFEDARRFCQSQGGDLVTFTDIDENSYFAGSQYNYKSYFIGLRADYNIDNELVILTKKILLPKELGNHHNY